MEIVVTTGAMTCKAPVKSSPPTNQHPVLFAGQMTFLSPNQQWTRNKNIHAIRNMWLLNASMQHALPQVEFKACKNDRKIVSMHRISWRYNALHLISTLTSGCLHSGILLEWRMMEMVVTTGATTCKAPVKSPPPTNQHPVLPPFWILLELRMMEIVVVDLSVATGRSSGLRKELGVDLSVVTIWLACL